MVLAWLGLVALTLASLFIAEWLPAGMSGLALLIAAIIWAKGWILARFYLETELSRRIIRRATWAFVAFVPVGLLLTSYFGQGIAVILGKLAG
jgi:hypothetical protein